LRAAREEKGYPVRKEIELKCASQQCEGMTWLLAVSGTFVAHLLNQIQFKIYDVFTGKRSWTGGERKEGKVIRLILIMKLTFLFFILASMADN
jgi:hypothetical protein